MSQELWIGVVLLAIAAGLFFIGLPDKDGVSPRFLRFEAAARSVSACHHDLFRGRRSRTA